MTPELLGAFVTLTVLEIVFGIDNIVFISILSGRLPREQQKRHGWAGLGFAMIMRIGLLVLLAWVMGLTADLFHVAGNGISGRDLILLLGGTLLVLKATREAHNSLEGETEAY